MKIFIRQCHEILKSGLCTSSNGFLGEYAIGREYGNVLADIFREKGHAVCVYNPKEKLFTDSSQALKEGVDLSKKWGADIFISCHANCFKDDQANGTEVCCYNSNENKIVAGRIAKAISSAIGTKVRNSGLGYSARNDLYEINSTSCPAYIVEPIFVSSKEDCAKWDAVKVAIAIYESVTIYKYVGKYKENIPQNNYKGETIVLVNAANSTDMNAAKYFNIYLGYGILTAEQYLQRANTKDTLIGIGGSVCDRIKCTYPVIGKDGVDTCQKAMELIQSLR